jgi:hypothetical protein
MRAEPQPYWRGRVSENMMYHPDIVTEKSYTVCLQGVVSTYVCTSGAQVCWKDTAALRPSHAQALHDRSCCYDQTSRHVRVMSVMPLKTDIHQRGLHVRLVPETDIEVIFMQPMVAQRSYRPSRSSESSRTPMATTKRGRQRMTGRP